MAKEGEIYPHTFSGKSLQLIEKRSDGNNVYLDLSDGSRVVCTHDSLFAYPPRQASFAPVGANYAAR